MLADFWLAFAKNHRCVECPSTLGRNVQKYMKGKRSVTYWLVHCSTPMLQELFHAVCNYFVSHDVGWKDTDNTSTAISDDVFTSLDKMLVPLPIISAPEHRVGGSS